MESKKRLRDEQDIREEVDAEWPNASEEMKQKMVKLELRAQRADEEKQRADEEKQRADEEKQRADEKQALIEVGDKTTILGQLTRLAERSSTMSAYHKGNYEPVKANHILPKAFPSECFQDGISSLAKTPTGWSTETSIAGLVCRTLEDAIIAASLKAKTELHPETYLTARLRPDGVFIEMPQKTRVGVVEVKVPCPNATAALEDEVVLGQIMAYLLALLHLEGLGWALGLVSTYLGWRIVGVSRPGTTWAQRVLEADSVDEVTAIALEVTSQPRPAGMGTWQMVVAQAATQPPTTTPYELATTLPAEQNLPISQHTLHASAPIEAAQGSIVDRPLRLQLATLVRKMVTAPVDCMPLAGTKLVLGETEDGSDMWRDVNIDPTKLHLQVPDEQYDGPIVLLHRIKMGAHGTVFLAFAADLYSLFAIKLMRPLGSDVDPRGTICQDRAGAEAEVWNRVNGHLTGGRVHARKFGLQRSGVLMPVLMPAPDEEVNESVLAVLAKAAEYKGFKHPDVRPANVCKNPVTGEHVLIDFTVIRYD